MAKIHARNAGIFGRGRDITGNSNSVTLSQNADAPDVTVFQNDNMERLSNGVTDIEMSVNGFFNWSPCSVDELFSEILAGSAYFGFYPEAATASLGGREFIAVVTEYSQEYATDSAVATTLNTAGCGTMHLVTSLGLATITGSSGSSTLPSVDFSGSAASNTAFFRVLELDGTNPDVTACVQQSNDDAAWVTTACFTPASAADVVVLEVYNSASRYRRVRYAVEGTSPSAKFLVATGSNI